VAARSLQPVLLRNGAVVEDPLGVALDFVEAYGASAGGEPARAAAFDESDLRRANRGGARISAAQIAAILQRRGAIERALRAIDPGVSLAGPATDVPWPGLGELFDAFGGIRGVGLSKATKALHPKRPALIPMLDSVVQRYLVEDDIGARAPFGGRALALVRGYRRDLDRNRSAVQAVREELADRGHVLTEVRILDVLIWSVGVYPRWGLQERTMR
jgi:uncharacterized protein DUF6308